ncbi:SGT1 family protein Sgt1 [Dendryphion nanum]|uniref:SGT1 family protein Sgt1 n=1 Tax=Dendryphion nanum TaxID=256645 RepID=A0A9P9I6Y5_9PLEO|nr:SGT1 family protein Sgt1 [Dendryphion nanum]
MENPIPQDDFQWFGQGFSGFPKRLPEDVVEYLIFIIDAKLSDTQTRERLQAFQRALTALEKKFLKEYIWQRESIKLDLVRPDGRWMLRGASNFGDSVADEWLIVYLLRELSSQFKDAWIRIYDTDGEFLLIEAANALPKWLNPEVSEHRVWIHNHRLLVIPLSQVKNPAPLELKEALAIISDTPAKPQHHPKVEQEAFHRLKGYPTAISENQHHATLSLPRRVAHILHANPAYIAPVVEAFYLRDPISLRLLQPDKTNAPLLFPVEDFVQVSVRFTKVLYAQLLGQRWNPPGSYSSALSSIAKNDTNPIGDKVDVGFKVTAGMEILLQHSIYASKTPVREIKILLEDLSSGEDTLPTDLEIAQWPQRSDDEAWLNIDFSDFERELSGKGTKDPSGATSGFGDKNAQENLRKMVERFNTFLEDEDAGVDGAGNLDPMDFDNDSDTAGESRGWDDPEESSDEDDDMDASEKDASKNKKKNKAPEDDDGGEDAYADEEYAEYESAFQKFMTLSAAEKALLTDDARELARESEAQQEEDEEIRKLTEMMEKELFSHAALDLNTKANKSSKTKQKQNKKEDNIALDAGEAKPTLQKGKGKAKATDALPRHDTYENGDSSDGSDGSDNNDDETDYLDEDYNLADNMLKAFKGQAGMTGPAGNMMRAMGIQFPPDDEDDDENEDGNSVNGASSSTGQKRIDKT